ncbi:MAG TPA: FAD-dependent monooxygenase, partial [Steroidobacteraceae bacterium]
MSTHDTGEADDAAAPLAAQFDIVVVGGGPVGACVAALLVRGAGYPSGTVALLERERPACPRGGEPLDLRVSAFSRASERVLAAAGAWAAIAAERVGPYERMRVWHASAAPDSAAVLEFDAADVAEPNLGHIIENRRVQHALLEAFERAGGRVIAATLSDVRLEAARALLVTDQGTLGARLVIGADGARSLVREFAGIASAMSDYQQSALVCVVASERPHGRTARQRFLGDGTLALLPLPDGTCSVVWSLPTAAAQRLRAAPAEMFAADITAASAHALGGLQLRGERLVLPLQRLSAAHYVRERCALIGDAAHVVHPLAGQGVNLGLLDAAALAEALAQARLEGEDPGALRVLRGYERRRKGENELMSAAIDAFNRLLATGSGPLSRLAQNGLGLVNRSQFAKRLFIEQALGTAGG